MHAQQQVPPPLLSTPSLAVADTPAMASKPPIQPASTPALPLQPTTPPSVTVPSIPAPTQQSATQLTQPPTPTPQASPEKAPQEIGTHGNWMKKREWLLKSNEVNIEIQKIAADSERIQKKFIALYKEIDDILDEFYNSQGLEQGKIEELFESINRFLEKKKSKEVTSLGIEADDPHLQDKIEVIEEQINTYRQELEQLRLDMKSIEDLDRSLTDRLKRLEEHLEQIDQEAENANKIIDDLWYIIDDNKARSKYYDLKKNILEKVSNSKAYLEDSLLSDFESVIETINNQIMRVKDELDTIESKGFIIKDRASRVEALKIKDLEDIDLAKKEKEIRDKIIQKRKIKKEPVVTRSWYESIYDTFIAILSSGYQSGIWIKDTLFGIIGLTKKPPEPKRKT